MNTRPTSETDAEEIIITKGKPTHWVAQEFARKLERERDEAREELSEWRILNGWGGTPEIIHDFIKGQQTRIHHAQDLEEELATVTAQRDRLAEALQETISGYDVVTESIPSLCSDYVHNVIAPLLSDVKG